jgi:hypothetical protein
LELLREQLARLHELGREARFQVLPEGGEPVLLLAHQRRQLLLRALPLLAEHLELAGRGRQLRLHAVLRRAQLPDLALGVHVGGVGPKHLLEDRRDVPGCRRDVREERGERRGRAARRADAVLGKGTGRRNGQQGEHQNHDGAEEACALSAPIR